MQKRNPIKQNLAKEILNEADEYRFLGEGEIGEVYYFFISKNLKIKTTFLKPGEYILKLEKYEKLSNKEKGYLRSLSDKRLIPRIYYNDNEIMIQSYFSGMTLKDFIILYNNDDSLIFLVLNEIAKKLAKWHYLAIIHGDLNYTNILVNVKEIDIQLIDPVADCKLPISSDIISIKKIFYYFYNIDKYEKYINFFLKKYNNYLK